MAKHIYANWNNDFPNVRVKNIMEILKRKIEIYPDQENIRKENIKTLLRFAGTINSEIAEIAAFTDPVTFSDEEIAERVFNRKILAYTDKQKQKMINFISNEIPLDYDFDEVEQKIRSYELSVQNLNDGITIDKLLEFNNLIRNYAKVKSALLQWIHSSRSNFLLAAFYGNTFFGGEQLFNQANSP